MDFDFTPVCVGRNAEPVEQLQGIRRYFKEWGDYAPDALSDISLCVLALYERVETLEATVKDQAERLAVLEGYKATKRKDIKTVAINTTSAVM